jgi:hypothetical protein
MQQQKLQLYKIILRFNFGVLPIGPIISLLQPVLLELSSRIVFSNGTYYLRYEKQHMADYLPKEIFSRERVIYDALHKINWSIHHVYCDKIY